MRALFLLILLGSSSLQAAEICRVVHSALDSELDGARAMRSRPFLRVLFLTRERYLALAASDSLLPTDFIVVDEMPTNVDPQVVAGILSRKEIPPFSHLAIAAAKMGIPILVSQDAAVTDLFRRHENNEVPQTVDIVPHGDTFLVDIKSASDLGENRRPPIAQAPVDRDFTDLLTRKQMERLTPKVLVSRYGEKVANLIRAAQNDGGSRHAIPEKLTAAPFGIFFAYLEQAGLAKAVARLLAPCEKDPSNHALVARNLEQIRNAISANEIPREMLLEIAAAMEQTGGNLFRNWRFRSTNDVEDSLGAGIYSSFFLPRTKHAHREARLEEISQAIRSVWSSLYTFRAFQVRRLYGLAEKEAAMAVLIHPSVENVVATGLTSVRSYYGNVMADTVAYRGNESATSPTGLASFEHFQASINPSFEMTIYKQGEPVKQARTSMEVLSFDEYETVLFQAAGVLRYWEGEKPRGEYPSNVELSFEWVMLEQGKLVLLQVKQKPIEAKAPAAPEYSRFLPPEIVASIHERTKDVELDALIDPLKKDHGFLPLKEVIFESLDSWGKIPSLPYFVLKVNGKPLVLTFNVGSHMTYYFILRSYFERIEVPFEVVDYGRFHMDFVHSRGELILRKMQFFNLRDYDATLGLPPASPERLRAHAEAMALNGAIRISDDSDYTALDEAYFPGSSGKAARGKLIDLVRP